MKITRNIIKTKDKVNLSLYNYSPSLLSSPPPPPSSSSSPKKLFFSHANGFHGRIFDQTINKLINEYNYNYNCISIDLRGHGQSTYSLPMKFNWELMADDILTVLNEINDDDDKNEKIIGVGHSFGATSLLIAAHKDPNRFSKLILYEPVIFPFYFRFISRFIESPLAKAALKRRRIFPSIEAAIENFSTKPPMKSFHPDVLKDYCQYGLIQINENEWTLTCPPENEAAVFNSGNEHATMNDLHQIKVPILLISGREDPSGLSRFMKSIANKLPNCQFVKWEEYGHLGPMENPEKFAQAIHDFVESSK